MKQRKNTNDLTTNYDDATFSINIPISKNFQTKNFFEPLSSNHKNVHVYFNVCIYMMIANMWDQKIGFCCFVIYHANQVEEKPFLIIYLLFLSLPTFPDTL